jgi:carbonic anhydrase
MGGAYLSANGTFPNGTTILESYKPTGMIEFHTPSEHTFLGGQHYDVEMEILYTNSEGGLARASMYFDRSFGGNTRNSFIDSLQLDTPGATPLHINFQLLLNKISLVSLWYYEGSIPYPPCTENVKWFLFNDP